MVMGKVLVLFPEIPAGVVHDRLTFSTAGASILGIGYLLPMIYFAWSLKKGKLAGANPWGASGLEWQTPSPPPTENFPVTPAVVEEPYQYPSEEEVARA